MNLIWGDFARGALGPGSGLRKMVSGGEAQADFAAGVETGIADFYKSGREAWEKSKEDDKTYRARIKLLMASGVKNKELAVALADQDQDSFDNLMTGFRDAQRISRDALNLRDYVEAEGIPMEDDPTRSPFGPTEFPEERVVADLTAETIDETVDRLVGKVQPGTLDREQESTFKSTIRDNLAKMGFGSSVDLSRREALEGAMKRRPPGVSEEDWLGFIEGKDRERGDPSTVTFRATPFSREAEMEYSTLENQHEKSVLELEALRRTAKTDEEYDRMRGKSFKDLGFTLSEDMTKMASRVGIELTENTILKDFQNEFRLKSPVIELFIKMDKASQAGKTKYSDAAHFRNVAQGRKEILHYFAGKVLGGSHDPTTGFNTFKSPDQYIGIVKDAIESYSQLRSELVFDALVNQNMTQPQAHKYAIDKLKEERVLMALGLTGIISADNNEVPFLDQIKEADAPVKVAESISMRELGFNKDGTKMTESDANRMKGLDSVLTLDSTRELSRYLFKFAEDIERERLQAQENMDEDKKTGAAPAPAPVPDADADADAAAAAAAAADAAAAEQAASSIPTETINIPSGLDITSLTTALAKTRLEGRESITSVLKKAGFELGDINKIYKELQGIASPKNPTPAAIIKPISEVLKRLISGAPPSAGDTNKPTDATPKPSSEFPLEVSPTRERLLDRKEKLRLIKSKLMQAAGMGMGGRGRAKPRDSVEMRRVAKLSTLMNQLSTDVRDLSESEQEAYDALIKNPIEYIDSVIASKK